TSVAPTAATQDILYTYNITSNDDDGNTVTITAPTRPTWLTLTDNNDGTATLTGTPLNANTGDNLVTLRVSDGTAQNEQSFTIVVVDVNDAPTATPDTYSTNEDTQLIIEAPGVLANDNDVDNTTLQAYFQNLPANGSLNLNIDGSFIYTPADDFYGTDAFTYLTSDGSLNSEPVTVTIQIILQNDLPVNTGETYNLTEDSELIVSAPGLLENDSDIDSPNLNAQLVTDVSNGSLSFSENGSFTYQPNAHFQGADSFTYTVSDGVGIGNTVVVDLLIAPINDQPIAANDYVYTAENTPVNSNVLSNDTDPNDPNGGINQSSLQLYQLPKHGSATILGNQTINYVPYNGFYGKDTLSYIVYDTGYPLPAIPDTAFVYIDISRLSPLAIDDEVTIDEDEAITIHVLRNDIDIDINPSSLQVVSPPSHGTADVLNGRIRYEPALNFNGMDQLTYRISDLTGLTSNEATVSITVSPVPDAPVLTDASFTTPENEAVDILLSSLVSDPEDNVAPSTLVITDQPSNGTTSLDGVNGIITYTPTTGYSGSDHFSITVRDETNLISNTGTITITISNEAPNAINDEYQIDEDAVTVFMVLDNDTDPQNNIAPSTLAIQTAPQHGSVSIDNGTVQYIPTPNYFGTDNFMYQICDESDYCDQATVTVTINPVNDIPILINDDAETPEDTDITIDVLANDTDIDDTVVPTTLSISTAPQNGTAIIDRHSLQIVYSPNPNFNGTDTFDYTVEDESGGQAQATASITVIPVNDPPQPINDEISTNEETPVIIHVLENDSDLENNIDSCSVSILVAPTHGTANTHNYCGRIEYTPETNFTGSDQLTYQVCDSVGLCAEATVTIRVNNANDAPIANDDAYTIDEDQTISMNVVLNDSDSDSNIDSTQLSVSTAPNHGTAQVIDNRINYTPATDYNGSDTFTYQICDSTNLCSSASITITISPVNDNPVAHDDFGQSDPSSGTANIYTNVADNDDDVDDNLDLLSIIVVEEPLYGTTTVETGTGIILYKPNPDFFGNDSYKYRICDTNGLCAIASVYLSVTTGNVPPTPQPDYVSLNEDKAIEIKPLRNDTDPNDNLDHSALSVVNGPQFGSYQISIADTAITYIPDVNFFGEDMIEYKVCDTGEESCAIDTIFITVNPVNDAPVATDDILTVIESNTIEWDVASNDSDIDEDVLTATIHASSPGLQGSAEFIDRTTLSYTAPLNKNCFTEEIIYEICDDNGGCHIASAFITVSPLDTDGDGIPDILEHNENGNPIDSDGDGDPNYDDPDSDNDGISDAIEGGLTDACADNLKDSDADGTPDFLDTDSDDDNIPDKEEGTDDCDGDGIPNNEDNDDDCRDEEDADTQPTIFTPNGDGINQYFEIPGVSQAEIEEGGNELFVFNRWGGQVFYKKNYDNKWDGKSEASTLGSADLPEGTYFYVFKVNDGTVIKGTVYIKR
ncbi:MAG: tandem-95 repeat protein, partial [Marinilabiliaceae bacterium]|nr:tandem-95 repeat protein [Marinilabiliaceae bacterium]